jgi:transcriptional regulator with XRE-family HTH domain
MSENDNKRRLISIGYKVKEAREKMGLTQEQFADKYGYARTTLAKLEAGIRDFKSTEIITLAEQLNVSCDYLLGRSRAAAPDNFMQEVVTRYGLTEQALQFIERLNAPLDIDSVEYERIAAKQKAHDDSPFNHAPTQEEFQTIIAIDQDETNKQALSILNELLTASTGREWETYGLQILTTIYNYCRREFENVEQVQHGITGRTSYTLTADTQRNIELYNLNDILARLRDKLTKEG